MKAVSLFSGIGGFDLGFQRAGIEIIASCDNDTNCRNILARHFAESKLFDDVKKVGRKTHGRNTVDIIVGGFPCQDLSIAGKRKGLAGERSGLWYEFARVIDELEPRWFVIENVPGLLSSQEGQDFAIILCWLAERGYGTCWRVLDSQYFGVAQRRRRVYIVGSLANGNSAKVLFESESVQGNPRPKREAGQVAPTLFASGAGTDRVASAGSESEFCIPVAFQQNVRDEVRLLDGDGQIAGALQAEAGMKQQNYIAFQQNERVFPTLEASDGDKWGSNQWVDKGNMILQSTVGALQARDGKGIATTIDDKLIAFQHKASSQRNMPVLEELSPTMETSHTNISISGSMGVRRLTPTECERLQGFPDQWTEWGVDEKGKKVFQSDSVRYRQLGNAVTVNVAEWIAKRIVKVEAEK